MLPSPQGKESKQSPCPPPFGDASLFELQWQRSELGKELAGSSSSQRCSPTLLMTTGVIQREREKTYPKVWKVKVFHAAGGPCVCSTVWQTSRLHCFTSLPPLAHVTPAWPGPPSWRGFAWELTLEPLPLSCHKMARRSLSHYISQEADIPMMLLKSGTFCHTVRKSFWWGQGDGDTFSPRSSLQPQHLMYGDISHTHWYTHTHTPQIHFLAE